MGFPISTNLFRSISDSDENLTRGAANKKKIKIKKENFLSCQSVLLVKIRNGNGRNGTVS